MEPWALGLLTMIYGAILGASITYVLMITWFQITCPEKFIV